MQFILLLLCFVLLSSSLNSLLSTNLLSIHKHHNHANERIASNYFNINQHNVDTKSMKRMTNFRNFQQSTSTFPEISMQPSTSASSSPVATSPQIINEIGPDHALYTLINVHNENEFCDEIKKLAVKNNDKLNNSNKIIIVREFGKYVNHFNATSFSYCVWALGKLQISEEHTKGLFKKGAIIEYTSLLSNSADRIDLLRMFLGLGKMGYIWGDIPANMKGLYYDMIYNVSSHWNGIKNEKQISEGTVIDDSQYDSREASSILYTLGLLKPTISTLPTVATAQIIDNFEFVSSSSSSTPQGFSNSLFGISKIGFVWNNFTESQQNMILLSMSNFFPHMHSDELSSSIQSLAFMKVQWDSLSQEFRDLAFLTLDANLVQFGNRELSNILWALAKLGLNYSNIPQPFQDNLTAKISVASNSLKAFDLESIIFSLGQLKFNFSAAPLDIRNNLLKSIAGHVSSMNIFCIVNTFWGLAKMQGTTNLMGDELSTSLLKKTISVFHTFLRAHYGDLVWSIAAVGYRKSNLTVTQSDRLLAVLSRIFTTQDNRGAANMLWGLHVLGYKWEDLKLATRSVADGRIIVPLADSVVKFLRQHISSMKEQEFSITLSALGELELKWMDLPLFVTEKIDHRITRVASYLSTRSLSDSLYGLGRMGANWRKFPEVTQKAWETAICGGILEVNSNENTVSSGTIPPITASKLPPNRGVANMNRAELSQSLLSLGLLRCEFNSLDPKTQAHLGRAIGASASRMHADEKKCSLWGLVEIGYPSEYIPASLQPTATATTIDRKNNRSSKDEDIMSELISPPTVEINRLFV